MEVEVAVYCFSARKLENHSSIFTFRKSQTLPALYFIWSQTHLGADLTWLSRCWLKTWQHPHRDRVGCGSSRHRLCPQTPSRHHPNKHPCVPTHPHRNSPTYQRIRPQAHTQFTTLYPLICRFWVSKADFKFSLLKVTGHKLLFAKPCWFKISSLTDT